MRRTLLRLWADSPVKAKILALALSSFAVPFLLSVSLIRANYRAVESFAEDVDAWAAVNRLRLSSDESARLLAVFLERGAFSDLNAYNESVDRFVAALGTAEGRTRDTEAVFLLHSIRNTFESWYDEAHAAIRGRIAGYEDPYAAYYRSQRIVRYLDGYVSLLMDRVLVEGTRSYGVRLERAGVARVAAVVLLACCALFCVVFAAVVSDRLSSPLHRLSAAAQRMAGGDQAAEPVRVAGADEGGTLSAAFEAMNAKIRGLVQDLHDRAAMERKLHQEILRNERNAKLLRESEFQALQARINPHFIFNTLGSISHDVTLRGGANVPDLVDALASLLRYGLDLGSGESNLAAELEIVRRYAFIQSRRFGGRIAVEIDCRVEDPAAVPMPAFTLQPLVENAFIHGLEPKEEGGTILVGAERRGGTVAVTVADDGIGMDAERIRAIRGNKELAAAGHLSSIGISNVRERLRLFTGDGRCFSIRAAEGGGTMVEIFLRRRFGAAAG